MLRFFRRPCQTCCLHLQCRQQLSDMFLSIYGCPCWHMSKFSPGPIDYRQTLHRTPWSFSGHSVFINKSTFAFPTNMCLRHNLKIHSQERDMTLFVSCVYSQLEYMCTFMGNPQWVPVRQQSA